MKKFLKYFMLTLVVSAFILASCSKSDDEDPNPPTPVVAFEVLKDYMIASNLDVNVVIDSWIIDAAGVNAKGSDDFYIIDLRSQEDFDLGHIADAVNSTLGGILTAAEAATKPILVVCYTGQSAGHGVIALRLSGHTDAKVLKWGMSGWRADLSGPWASNVSDTAIGHANWEVPPGTITDPVEFDAPVIESSFTSGPDILAERVDEMLANGFSGIPAIDVLTAPADFFVNNYWAADDVVTYGNITGAYRLSPFTLADDTYKNLDPSKTIVSYCWTGQTSSMLTAYFWVLGYDAKSLKFGVNALIYSNLTGHYWEVPGTDYPVVATR
ncbi:MAG: rhodanese-like domain-containing protein [Bacteroidetes bacterium]|nr:rhodanese-like domain-containing protein [Bacteroidota bacterium]